MLTCAQVHGSPKTSATLARSSTDHRLNNSRQFPPAHFRRATIFLYMSLEPHDILHGSMLRKQKRWSAGIRIHVLCLMEHTSCTNGCELRDATHKPDCDALLQAQRSSCAAHKYGTCDGGWFTEHQKQVPGLGHLRLFSSLSSH